MGDGGLARRNCKREEKQAGKGWSEKGGAGDGRGGRGPGTQRERWQSVGKEGIGGAGLVEGT